MTAKPDLELAPTEFLKEVVTELERRIGRVDARELDKAREEIDESLELWDAMKPGQYYVRRSAGKSLLQSADDHAGKVAAGRLPEAAWPVMNSMRSVEPATPFRLKETLRRKSVSESGGPGQGDSPAGNRPAPRWRR
jgi:hypothetical protein